MITQKITADPQSRNEAITELLTQAARQTQLADNARDRARKAMRSGKFREFDTHMQRSGGHRENANALHAEARRIRENG